MEAKDAAATETLGTMRGNSDSPTSSAACGGRVNVMSDELESSAGAHSVVELVEELHEASSEAAALGFPRLARLLDECGFELASELADDRQNQRALVDRARRCLDVWRAMREW